MNLGLRIPFTYWFKSEYHFVLYETVLAMGHITISMIPGRECLYVHIICMKSVYCADVSVRSQYAHMRNTIHLSDHKLAYKILAERLSIVGGNLGQWSSRSG